MNGGKFCIFFFIIAELTLSVSQKEVKMDKGNEEMTTEIPKEQISLESLDRKMEEMLALIVENHKRAKNLIRNSIAPAKRELTQKIEELGQGLKNNLSILTDNMTFNLAEIKSDVKILDDKLNSVTDNVTSNLAEIKSDVKILDDKLYISNNKLILEVDTVKSNMLVENKIIKSKLNEFATEFVKVNELSNKINNKCENNNNKLIELQMVIDGFKRFKLQSEINDKNQAPESSKLNKSQINLEISGPVSPRNCAEILENGDKQSEIRTVYPSNGPGISVLCDQLTDGGGWTVFQTRDYLVRPRVNFSQKWSAYTTGFGDLEGEFWLGLENIHQMTQLKNMELRIDMEDGDGVKKFAIYKSFRIGNSQEKYTLNIGSYTGDAGDSLSNLNLNKFSTKDQDNDGESTVNCAETSVGGWWYNGAYYECFDSNLNGHPFVGDFDDDSLLLAHGIVWKSFRGWNHSMSKTRMMLRPQRITK